MSPGSESVFRDFGCLTILTPGPVKPKDKDSIGCLTYNRVGEAKNVFFGPGSESVIKDFGCITHARASAAQRQDILAALLTPGSVKQKINFCFTNPGVGKGAQAQNLWFKTLAALLTPGPVKPKDKTLWLPYFDQGR